MRDETGVDRGFWPTLPTHLIGHQLRSRLQITGRDQHFRSRHLRCRLGLAGLCTTAEQSAGKKCGPAAATAASPRTIMR